MNPSDLLLTLLLLALLLLVVAALLRRWSGLPPGLVTYSDTDRPAAPLTSQRYGLVGKPDYIVQYQGRRIPVEVKPSRRGQPYDSDRLQLAAYCLLIEDTFGEAPPFGVLRYRNAAHRIAYTPALKDQVLRSVESIRAARYGEPVHRSHQSVARCRACGYRSSCEQRLA